MERSNNNKNREGKKFIPDKNREGKKFIPDKNREGKKFIPDKNREGKSKNFRTFFRKSKKGVPYGFKNFSWKYNLCLWIKQTYNNVFLTVTNNRGDVRVKVSGGFSKLRGSNRTSYRSISIVMHMLFMKLKKVRIGKVPFKSVWVFLVTPKSKVTGPILDKLSRFYKVRVVMSRLRIPHNGLRHKKLRRL